LQVAASVRTDFACLGPAGSGSESIATRIHQLSCPGEPIITIDGPLMDAELLDASLSSIMRPLSDSPAAQATALLRGLDETPSDAQQRLAEILATFGGRLRLIGLCGSKAGESPQEQSAADTVPSPIQEATIDVGVDTRLSETLSALIITIDPLASRVSDLPAMATALLDRMRAAGHTAAERFNRAALDAIVIYPWPNNFEELREAVRHAARRAEGPAIGIEHLPLAIRSFRSGEQPRPPKPSAVSLDQAVARFERQLIEQAIAASDGNRAAAARQLGISRARLLRKIAESEANRSGH
jgi:DNA-binding NtrC family response regulator